MLRTSYRSNFRAQPPGIRYSAFIADVDGTLIRSVGEDANKLHKEAFAVGLKELFKIDTTIDVVEHHGSTDPLILIKVLEFHGISRDQAMEKLPQMQQVMIDHFLSRAGAAGQGLQVLGGVACLLRELGSRDDVAVCLVTGNLEPIAWAKMEALGIKHLFTKPVFGGFGSDYCSGDASEMGWRDRAELVKIAAQRCAERCGIEVGTRVHVGDAPMDVRAAKAAGAVPVGLLTGIYTREQLLTACPSAMVLDSLESLDDVLAVCKLTSSTPG